LKGEAVQEEEEEDFFLQRQMPQWWRSRGLIAVPGCSYVDLCHDVNLSCSLSCSEGDLMKLLCCHLGRQTESRSVTFVLRIFCVRVCSCFCILPHPAAVKPVWGSATYFRSLATGPSVVDYHIRVRNTVLFTERLTASWTRLSAAPCYSLNPATFTGPSPSHFPSIL
jgi:hypothetical protein